MQFTFMSLSLEMLGSPRENGEEAGEAATRLSREQALVKVRLSQTC